ATLELRTRLPQLLLHGIRRGQARDVEELQFSDVVQRQRTLAAGDLGEKLHVRWQAGRGSELFAGIAQPEKQAGTRKDFVVAAHQPCLLLRGTVPVGKQ